MRLDAIHLVNYGRHADLVVRFGPHFNVLVGVNGSGKTSLLAGIAEALNGYAHGIQTGTFSILGDPGLVRLEKTSSGDRIRFEPRYPISVEFSGVLFDQVTTWSVTRASSVGNGNLMASALWEITRKYVDAQVDTSKPLPVLAFYRATRYWSPVPPNEMRAVSSRDARKDGYARWDDASIDSAALQAWAIGKSLERLQTSSETGLPFADIDGDELALVNRALAETVEGSLGLRYDLKQKMLMIEWTNERDPTPFENLSDGQRSAIGMVADIARRMCILNPQLGDDVTDKTPGIVLIDELDMHLHPAWQRILTRGLRKAFPSVQFIVASHSPQVLSELSPEEIILLHGKNTGHPQVSYGMDSNRVLEEIMDAPSRPIAVEEALASVFMALERNELEQARLGIAKLSELAPGIAEIGAAEALLKRKELIGR